MVDPSFQLFAAAAGPGDSQEMFRLVQQVLSWVYPACPVVAAVLCFSYRQLTSRLMVLGFGFVVHAIVMVGYRLVPYFIDGDFEKMQRINTLLNFAGLGAWAMILFGLFLVLSDLQKRDDEPLSMARSARPTPRGEEPEGEARDRNKPRRMRREGSNDIQA